MKNDGGDHASI